MDEEDSLMLELKGNGRKGKRQEKEGGSGRLNRLENWFKKEDKIVE